MIKPKSLMRMTRRRRRGLTSLDALILFVAIVIATGVAGIILMSTGNTLTQKTMAKASEGKKSVTSGIEALSAIGNGATLSSPTPHVVDDVAIMVRLLPGTQTIDFNSTIIIVDAGVNTETMGYNTSCNNVCTAGTSPYFNVYYLKFGSAHESGYLNPGDIAKIAVKPASGIAEDQDVRITIIPAQGPKTELKFHTPEFMVAKEQFLWPTS